MAEPMVVSGALVCRLAALHGNLPGLCAISRVRSE